MEAKPTVSLRRLTRSFTDGSGSVQQVIVDLTQDFYAGESVALWGPSGSGKTTLLNLLAGLLPPDSGSIELFPDTPEALRLETLDADGLARFRRMQVGYVFQFYNLIPTLTVTENIKLTLELAGKLEDWRAYATRLQALGLEDLADRFPEVLSGGEQQRVAVLRALAHSPTLVLADEPTGNLDQRNSDKVTELLWQQAKSANAVLLIATHSEAIAARADRVLEMR